MKKNLEIKENEIMNITNKNIELEKDIEDFNNQIKEKETLV